MGERVFVLVTAATALLTIVVSVLVVTDPGFALPAGSPVTPGVEAFALACSVRSLTVAGAVLVLLARRSVPGLIVLLWVTGLFQAGDVLVHTLNGSPAAAAAGILALVAFGSAGWLTRSRTNHARPPTDGHP